MAWTTLNPETFKVDTTEKMSENENSFELEIEDADDNQSVNDTKSPETAIERETSRNEETGSEEEEDSEEEEVKPKRPRSRARPRIEKLAKENRALREAQNNDIAALRAEIERLKGSQTTNHIENELKAVQTELRNTEALFAKALEDGESNTAAKLQTQISQLVLKEQIAESRKREVASVGTAPKPSQNQQEISAPAAFTKWKKDKEWLEYPENRAERKLREQVIKISEELREDGYDVHDSEFYDELQKSLQDYVNENSLDVEGFERTETEKKTEVKKSPTTSTSREASVSKSKNGKTVVKLTQEDLKLARVFNMTPQEWAKSKITTPAKTTNGANWTTVFNKGV